MQRIYLASGNPHKAAELQELARLAGLPVAVRSARELGGMPEVTEDTGTFVGNARKKAQALRSRVAAGDWVLADDSGVCVDALEGAPGVESAYFAGPDGDSAANLRKLLQVMAGVPDGRRGAHFHCVLLLATDTAEHVFEGICGGQILRAPRGSAGFGYDPIFLPDGFQLSYAELGDDVKNRISHRANAWGRFATWLVARRAPA